MGTPLPRRRERRHRGPARFRDERFSRGRPEGRRRVRRAQGLTTTATIEAIWRIEQPKRAARLTRMLRDVGLAEEVVQDAFVQALERWPRDGIPRNPAAWLTRVATN